MDLKWNSTHMAHMLLLSKCTLKNWKIQKMYVRIYTLYINVQFCFLYFHIFFMK